MRSADRSKDETSGWWASAASSGGATSACWTPWASIARSMTSRSKRARATTVPPLASAWLSTQPRPMLWKNGARPSTRSPSSIGNGTAICTRLATSERWVSWTAFGSPVVPLEESMTATSSGSGRDSGGAPPAAISSPNDGSPSTITSSTPACTAASRATAASGPTVIRIPAPVLRSWRASSAAVKSGLAGVTAPPARRPPYRTIGNSGRFGRCSASTSPRPNPRAARPAATRSMPPASSP